MFDEKSRLRNDIPDLRHTLKDVVRTKGGATRLHRPHAGEPIGGRRFVITVSRKGLVKPANVQSKLELRADKSFRQAPLAPVTSRGSSSRKMKRGAR